MTDLSERYSKLTCSCEASHKSVGQLACAYETHAHFTCASRVHQLLRRVTAMYDEKNKHKQQA